MKFMYFSNTILYSNVVIFPKRNVLKNQTIGNVYNARVFRERQSPFITYLFV